MKKVFSVFIILSFLFLTSCRSAGTFTKTDENHIFDSEGTEYVFLANEGFVYTLGSSTFLGKIKGEKSTFYHLSSKFKTGMSSCENDPERRTLIRSVPDSEWQSYYRKASLPPLDLSPENCIRFELLKGFPCFIDINHMSCNEGITDPEEIKEFLRDVKSQRTAEEVGLYNLVRREGGRLENCYIIGSVYGFFKNEQIL